MRTVILLRHARSTANSAGVLAGRSGGVELDEHGRDQAARLLDRLADVPLAGIVSSPILRCLQTVAPLAEERGLTVQQLPELAEVDYGTWTGRKLSELGGEPLWRVVQSQPSAAQFPEGESLAAVSARAVRAVRGLAAAPAPDQPAGPVLVCSHGDVIKAVLADALGMHLDLFQRINVGPASLSVVRYGARHCLVDLVGDTGSLAAVGAPPPAGRSGQPDAVVGGDTGTASGRDAGTAPQGAPVSAPESETAPAAPGGAAGLP